MISDIQIIRNFKSLIIKNMTNTDTEYIKNKVYEYINLDKLY